MSSQKFPELLQAEYEVFSHGLHDGLEYSEDLQLTITTPEAQNHISRPIPDNRITSTTRGLVIHGLWQILQHTGGLPYQRPLRLPEGAWQATIDIKSAILSNLNGGRFLVEVVVDGSLAMSLQAAEAGWMQNLTALMVMASESPDFVPSENPDCVKPIIYEQTNDEPNDEKNENPEPSQISHPLTEGEREADNGD